MAVRSGDDRQVCLRLLQRLASARRAIIGIYFPPIPWPMTSKRQDLSRYILEDILDCPVGSRFIACIAMEDNDDERSKYYSETARAIQSDLRRQGLPVETWRMSSKRYLVLQGRITRSLHYDDISMKSLTQRQFRDAFSNNSGDVANHFDGITTRLTGCGAHVGGAKTLK